MDKFKQVDKNIFKIYVYDFDRNVQAARGTGTPGLPLSARSSRAAGKTKGWSGCRRLRNRRPHTLQLCPHSAVATGPGAEGGLPGRPQPGLRTESGKGTWMLLSPSQVSPGGPPANHWGRRTCGYLQRAHLVHTPPPCGQFPGVYSSGPQGGDSESLPTAGEHVRKVGRLCRAGRKQRMASTTW